MRQRVKEEQAKANLLKALRTGIRLKYSLLADIEINEVLPKAEAKFNASLHQGDVLSLPEVKKALGL